MTTESGNSPSFISNATLPIRAKTTGGNGTAGAEKLLTQREVADQLGVTLQTLAKWHRDHKGPARIQLARNITRYKAEDVKAYLNGLRLEGASA